MNSQFPGRRRLSASGLLVIVFCSAIIGVLGPLVGPARASLFMDTLPYPDIFSGNISTDYDSGTQQFTANGEAMALMPDPDSGFLISSATGFGSFNLRATIDSSARLLPGGTLSITGIVPELGFTNDAEPLLIGSLRQFWFDTTGGPSGSVLEFLFDITGGAAASLYGGSQGGVALYPSNFPGDFSSDFGNGGAYSEINPVISDHANPEPCSLIVWSLLGGFGAAAGWRRLRRRRLG